MCAWQDVEGHNLLEMLYADRPQWSFPFQVLALATLGLRQTTLLAEPRPQLTVMERSPACSLRVFAQYLEDAGVIRPEHMAVLRLARAATAPPTQRPIHYVYVRTPAAEAHRRLLCRARTEEMSVTAAYLADLERLTDAWLASKTDPVYEIDGMLPPDVVLARAVAIIDGIAARSDVAALLE